MLIDGQKFLPVRAPLRSARASATRPAPVSKIHRVLGRYLRGQLVLIVLMSFVTFLVLEWAYAAVRPVDRHPHWDPGSHPAHRSDHGGRVACTVGFSQGGPNEAAALP